ncbi:MAG TPA: hypothetical protein VFO16_01255 [Pseudonocardiaceae bacterium]|nr:hypothetical protein [Pseudonocardiaceae bacterium]
MIREDRELLAEMASVNTDVVPLAMRIIDECATADEQHHFAERLIALARRLDRRAFETRRAVIEGTVLPVQQVAHSPDDGASAVSAARRGQRDNQAALP